MDFAKELDALITKAKAAGVHHDEMIPELIFAADGLSAEIERED